MAIGSDASREATGYDAHAAETPCAERESTHAVPVQLPILAAITRPQRRENCSILPQTTSDPGPSAAVKLAGPVHHPAMVWGAMHQSP